MITKQSSLLIIIILILFFYNCNESKNKPEISKTKSTKDLMIKKTPEEIDFIKMPVKYMAKIYKCYHDWKLKEGITLSENALIVIDEIYNKDPQQIIDDPALKLKKTFQIKSTLHTLKGLLHFRSTLQSRKIPVRDENQAIMKKLKKGKSITKKDFEELAYKIDKKSSSDSIQSKLLFAKSEFIKAIETDKSNPSPHFHLAQILKNSENIEIRKKAESHYYESAKLSIQEGDYKSIEKILTELKNLNGESHFIKKIRKISKRNSHGF